MKKTGWLMQLSLLSISFVLLSPSAINGAIPALAEHFSSQSLSSIELLSTMPLLALVVGLFLSNPISGRISPKNTVLTGLVLALIGGILPVFIDNFTLLLAGRALLGFGLGLFNSLSITLINDFFEGKKRTAMLGFQVGAAGGGAALLTLLAGQLVRFGWNYAFTIYFVIVPIFALFFFFVPNPTKKEEKTSYKIEPKVWIYVLMAFLFCIVTNIAMIKLPTLVVDKNFGTAPTASFMLFFLLVANMLAGMSFGLIYGFLKNKTIFLALFSIVLSYLFIALGNSQLLMMIGAILDGVGSALCMAYIFNQVGVMASRESAAFSTTAVLVSAQLAGFLAPFAANFFGSLPLLSNSIAQSFLTGAILALLYALLLFFYQKWQHIH